MTFAVCLLLTAPGQLTFQAVDPGITPILTAWRDESPSGWWSWSVSAFDQNADGKLDLYFATHSSQGATLLRQGATINDWTDVTVSLGQTKPLMPSESRPLFADIDKNGLVDVIAIGDENAKTNKLNFGASLQSSTGHARPLTYGIVIDGDGDTWLDAMKTNHRSYGKTSVQFARNNFGAVPPSENFTVTTTKIDIPPELPPSIQAELAALELDTNPSNRYCGPVYWYGDLNGDGRTDCIVQYAGGYSSSAYRFGRYLFQDENGVLIDKTMTCGIPPNLVPLLPPSDVNGDGKLDLVTGYGATTAAGLYQQNAGDTFTLQRVDALPLATTKDVWSSVYHTSASYLYKLHWHDFDFDGDNDLLVSRQRLGSFQVYENDAGQLKKVLSASHADADGYEICDLNGDGKLDVVAFGSVTHSDATTTFYLNTSGGSPPPPPPPGTIRVKLNGVDLPAGTTVKIDGVLVQPPTTGEKLIEIQEPN